MEDKRGRWVALTAIAPIAWGSTYFVTRHALPPDAALWGAVIRCLPAGLLVLLVARQLPHGSWWWRSVALGTLTVGGLNVLVYVAAQRLPTSLAATLMSTSAAAMLALSWLLLGQRPRTRGVVGAAVGILGVTVMMGPGGGPVDPWGVAAVLGAMLASSLGFVLTRRWAPTQGEDPSAPLIPPLTMAGWQLVAGSLVVLPFALAVQGAPPTLDRGAVLGFAYVITVATALAYVCWFSGLEHLPGGVVGVIGLLNPVTGVALGVLVGHEAFGPAQLGGLVGVLLGVMLGVAPTSTRSQCTRDFRMKSPSSIPVTATIPPPKKG